MQGANKKTGSKPEVRLRSTLHGLGLRFRKNHAIRTENGLVKPDIVFPRQRLAVFVDGCFWHACPDHGTAPLHNAPYWNQKLACNVKRDEFVNRSLAQAGWHVHRVWEHEDVTSAADQLAIMLRGLREQPRD